jgi:hypothetical protein
VCLLIHPIVTLHALAQGTVDRTGSFEALPLVLKVGQEVKVSREGERATRGKVVSISGDQLVIARRQYPFPYFRPRVERTFTKELISGIDLVDSNWNGVVIGAAGAVGFNAAWIESDCSPSCDDNFGKGGRWVLGSLLFVPIGMALGGLIDSLITKPVYGSRSGTPHVSVVPQFERGRKGIAAEFRF